MVLKIYNTMTRLKEVFKPVEVGKIKMYVCGITVYDYCHIGHARVMVAFDVIVRHLRSQGYDVTYVRNITDIDDKIFNRANDNGESYQALTDRFIEAMHEDEVSLNVLPPDVEPRASEHMTEILAMISTLVEKGAAYPAENGDVYFSIEQFETYGKLTNKNLEDLVAGARVSVDENKRNPLDFVLWKAAKKGEASWSSLWGEGRPGWHIECSAMSTDCLGDTLDIHGGGPDLPFPHHENEIAQSEAATGQTYVNTWMHAGAVRVNDEKMSKSLGNFFTIREVLKKYHPEVIRFFLISSHYRSPIGYSEESLKIAVTGLSRLYIALRDVDISGVSCDEGNEYSDRYNKAMNDDFNTPEAIAVLFELAKEINQLKGSNAVFAGKLAVQLISLGNALGLLQENPESFVQHSVGGRNEAFSAEIEALIVQRKQARESKDWALADKVRDELNAKKVVVEDRPDGSTVWRVQS